MLKIKQLLYILHTSFMNTHIKLTFLNEKRCKEDRHDQSIVSLLTKKYVFFSNKYFVQCIHIIINRHRAT